MARPPSGAGEAPDPAEVKSIAQLRQDALTERRNALVALIPARGAKLAELYFLLRDMQDPGRFGAGLDPSLSAIDPTHPEHVPSKYDKPLADFIQQWIRQYTISENITSMPPLQPPPPASPYRRNSQADMSEEVAALEKELIRPEYRQNKPLSRLNIDTDFPQNAHSSLHTASGPQPASGLRQRASSTAASPFPVTFRSPASTSRQTGADHNAPPILPESPFPVKLQSNASFASTSAAEIGEDTDKSIASPEKRTPSAPPFALNSYPVPYPPSLPPLPEYFLKQRPGLGGLAKKKRERTLVQSANPSAPLPAMNSDLYRLGVSRAQYGGVRSLVGAAAPMPGRTRGGGKVVMSTDWQVAVSELRTQKAMERIEQLKSDKTWSFRQLRKQRGPGTHKAHWDYLLDEMRWMAVDVRQETRWKIASAYAMSQEIKRWHEAGTPEARSALSIRRREVMQRDTSEVPLLPQPSDLGQSIDVDMTVEPPPESHASSQDDVKPQPENPPQRGPVMVALDAAQTATSRGRSGHIESPKFKKRAQAVMLARMPMFEENALKTVFDLSQAKFSHAHASFAISDIVHELLQDIPAYAPPPQPSDDPRTNRRIEESNPISSRITNTSHLLESKPLLVSTLHPSKKRKRSGDWQDLTSLASGLTEERSTLPSMFGTEQDLAFGQGIVKAKEMGSRRYQPAPPPNHEARAASLEWSADEDRRLFAITRQCSFNWPLIADMFNLATKRLPSDALLPWDCFDRFQKKFGPPTPLPQPTPTLTTAAPHDGVEAPPAQREQQTAPGAPSDVVQAATSPKRDRRLSVSLQVVPPVQPEPALPPTPAVPTVSKLQLRRAAMLEATKKAQKKREVIAKNNFVSSPRKVNLAAHETHNQPYYPNITALDLSRLKTERERAQLEEMRKRDQAKMYQQVQQAAMAQQHLQARQAQAQAAQAQAQALAQAQAQAQNQGQAIPPIPTPVPGQMPILPGMGTIPPNMAANQAALMQQNAQRMAQMQQQLSLQAQAQAQAQQNAAGRGQIVRPPSSSGSAVGLQGSPSTMSQALPNGTPSQIPMPNNMQSSPPLQPHNLQAMNMPPQGRMQTVSPMPGLQQNQGSPNGAMQLSPAQLPLHLQQQIAAAAAGGMQFNMNMATIPTMQTVPTQLPVNLTPHQQQAILASIAAARSGSPMQGVQALPQVGVPFPMQQAQQSMSPEQLHQQQQQMMAMMRLRQNSAGQVNQ